MYFPFASDAMQMYAIHENDFSAMFVSESEISMLETLRDNETYSGTRRQRNESAEWTKQEKILSALNRMGSSNAQTL